MLLKNLFSGKCTWKWKENIDNTWSVLTLWLTSTPAGARGALPYMAYMAMCRWIDLSVLNRVYNFAQVSPKDGLYFRILVLNRVRVSNHQRLTYMYTQILVQYPPSSSTACKLIFWCLYLWVISAGLNVWSEGPFLYHQVRNVYTWLSQLKF